MKSKPDTMLTTETQEYQDAKTREYLVVKHNDIIQKNKYRIAKNAGKSLTLLEQKVILYIISRIKPDDTELKEQIFTIPEFCRVCGIQAGGNNYPYIREIFTKLKSRVMWLISDDCETTVSWISKATIYPKSGKIKVRLDEDMKPYLIMLSRNYTAFPLHNIVKMKTRYGVMLYELLKSVAYKGKCVEFEVDELKESLDATSYDNFTNFKNKVLFPALKDINTYTELKVDVDYRKSGRINTHIIFTIENLNQTDTDEAHTRFYNTESELYKHSFERMAQGDNDE